MNTERDVLVAAEAALSRVIKAKCVGTIYDLDSPLSQCRDALKVVRDRLYGVYENPVCEECNEEKYRYTNPNTGRSGWSCDSCGWSDDD